MLTIRDIAAKAGVSVSTASRALNNNPRISQATRERIQKLAAAEGYLPNYNAKNLTAGEANAVGVLAAVQSIAAVVWSYVLAKLPNRVHKLGYAGSLCLGAIGFISVFFIHNQYTLIGSFVLVGIAWAAMNTYPLTMVTNALSGAHMGTYLGLFNGSICLPQIIASVASFALFPLLGSSQSNMFLLGGIVMVIGALSVFSIKETYKA